MLEKHHIVFKSQGGLDFELNYKYLTAEEHRGNLGPHLNRKIDLAYKIEMEVTLRRILENEFYTIKELIDLLGLKERQAYKAFRKVNQYLVGMKKEDIIYRLMGNSFYL
ncbi:hypothetical protein [Tissierella praeacuta]|uniref:hypothetical protein n=1 Tax=Tissierella praeacuta TaxID=43131 RepID=UPI00333F8789